MRVRAEKGGRMRSVKYVLCIAFVAFGILHFGENLYALEFEKGERLTYSARFLKIIPFGEVAMEVKDIVRYKGKKCYLVTCEARTARWLSLLFKAEATLGSYMDVDKLYPYKFEQVLKVAGKPDDIRRATYDRVNNIMEAEGKGKKGVPRDVRGPLSAIYYLRTQDLKEGDRVEQVVNNNQSNYILHSEVTGRKRIGKYECLVVDTTVRRENKSMYHSMDATFYISDDEKSLPVLVTAATQVGPVSLRLKK